MMNFALKNEKLSIKREKLCIKNEELCIRNDKFRRHRIQQFEVQNNHLEYTQISIIYST